MLRHFPLDRIDGLTVAALAGSTGATKALKTAADNAPDPLSLAGAAIRFTDVPLAAFPWHGTETYITPLDAITLASGVILFIRAVVSSGSRTLVSSERSEPLILIIGGRPTVR